MTNVVVNFHPFLTMQEILVYEDGACVNTYHVLESQIVDIIKGIKTDYKVDAVNLVGSTDYLKRYCEKLGSDFAQTDIHVMTR